MCCVCLFRKSIYCISYKDLTIEYCLSSLLKHSKFQKRIMFYFFGKGNVVLFDAKKIKSIAFVQDGELQDSQVKETTCL